MPWPRSWSLSALCPPCVRLESAAAAPPNLVCPPFVRCGRAPKLCPAWVRHVSTLCPLRVRFERAPKPCPACVRQVSALAVPPNLVRHVSTLCPVWLSLQTSAAMCRSGRRVSALCRLPPRLQALCLPSCPLCPPCVRSLSFLCSLVVRSLLALYPLLVRFLAGPTVWLWPCLCQLPVRSLVFAPLSVQCPLLPALVGLCGCAFGWQCSCLPSSFAVHLHPVFRFPRWSLFCLLSEFCLHLPVSGSLYRARPCGMFV